MKKYLFFIALLGLQCFAQVTVKLTSPANGSTVTAPIQLQASASSSHPIVGWHAYLDSNNVFTAGTTGSINGSVSAAAGKHQFVVRAWDSAGAYGDQTVDINVTSAPPTGVSVQLATPTSNSNVSSPFTMQASASSSHPIVGWHAYLDGANVFTGGNTGSVSANLTAGSGNHQLVIRAWDSTGAYGDQTINISVGGNGNGPLPTPPQNAIVFNNLNQQNTGWSSCKDSGCAGGSGTGNYWQAFFQGSPSMDGSSMELYRDGVWANALWVKKVGANNNVSHLLWDFYFYVDSASTSATQALEFDGFQFVGGYNYMIGSQCDYGNGHWDTWSETSGHWLPTTIACPKFAPNTWHHIQWYETLNHSNHSYTYVTLVVDGTAYPVNQTQYAKYLAWGDNLGVQWQLDVNATGNGYHEWVDKAKLTVW